MTTGHRLFGKQFLCFDTPPCRHMALLVQYELLEPSGCICRGLGRIEARDPRRSPSSPELHVYESKLPVGIREKPFSPDCSRRFPQKVSVENRFLPFAPVDFCRNRRPYTPYSSPPTERHGHEARTTVHVRVLLSFQGFTHFNSLRLLHMIPFMSGFYSQFNNLRFKHMAWFQVNLLRCQVTL